VQEEERHGIIDARVRVINDLMHEIFLLILVADALGRSARWPPP